MYIYSEINTMVILSACHCIIDGLEIATQSHTYNSSFQSFIALVNSMHWTTCTINLGMHWTTCTINLGSIAQVRDRDGHMPMSHDYII